MTDPKPIITFPNDVLRTRCEEFGGISISTKELAAELRASLSTTTGIGLAAPQIGESSRMILLKADSATRAGGGLIMIDPVILEHSDNTSLMMEGCLSLPGQRLPVSRPERVIVEYISETGRPKTVEFTGLAAKCAQHEIDHLDGILIIDRALTPANHLAATLPAAMDATFSHLTRSR